MVSLPSINGKRDTRPPKEEGTKVKALLGGGGGEVRVRDSKKVEIVYDVSK